MYPQVYEDFLSGMDVNSYCQQQIEPFAIELDHLGLQCLATSVINEAGIAIEVLYLDRSEGEEVNTHQFPVLDGQGKVVEGAPTIRLLYRPYVSKILQKYWVGPANQCSGHYDMLYKSEDVHEMLPMPISALQNPEVRLVSEPMIEQTFGTCAFSPTDDIGAYLTDIPGFTLGTPMPSFSSNLYQTPTQTSPMPSVSSPTTTVSTQLAHANLNPPVSERKPHKSHSTSSSTPEKENEIKFRGSEYQYNYQNCRAKLRSQQAKAGFSG